MLQCCEWIGIVWNFVPTVLQWEQKAILLDRLLIFIGTLLLSTVMNIYCRCKCVKPRMIYQALTAYEYREVCCASMQPQDTFMGFEIPCTLPGIRKTSIALQYCARHLVNSQVRIPPISQFCHKINETECGGAFQPVKKFCYVFTVGWMPISLCSVFWQIGTTVYINSLTLFSNIFLYFNMAYNSMWINLSLHKYLWIPSFSFPITFCIWKYHTYRRETFNIRYLLSK